MDVNYKLQLSAGDFPDVKNIADSMGVRYDGVAGGESNPHHKFSFPSHRSPWLFVIDSVWRTAHQIRFRMD